MGREQQRKRNLGWIAGIPLGACDGQNRIRKVARRGSNLGEMRRALACNWQTSFSSEVSAAARATAYASGAAADLINFVALERTRQAGWVASLTSSTLQDLQPP